MKKVLRIALNVFGWLVLLAAFSSLGFMTDNPRLMIPLYFIFFLVLFGLVLLYNMRKQRTSTINPEYVKIAKKVLGVILLLVGLLTPYFFFRGIGFTAGIFIILTIIVAVLIALSIFAIRLINRHHFLYNLVGYLILIVVCSMPAIIMMQHDRSYHALGLAYYAALVICVLAWWGFSSLGGSSNELEKAE